MLSTPNVLKVLPANDRHIQVTFETGETKLFDVTPYITGSWFGKLANDGYFRRVQPAGRTVVWPDGQDIAPHELYEDSTPVVM